MYRLSLKEYNLISSFPSTACSKLIYHDEKRRFYLSLLKRYAVRDFVEKHVGKCSSRNAIIYSALCEERLCAFHRISEYPNFSNYAQTS